MLTDAKKSASRPAQWWYQFQYLRYLESVFGLRKKAKICNIVSSKTHVKRFTANSETCFQLDGPFTDLQDAKEEDEDAEASVRRDVRLDLAVQSHPGHDAGKPDDEPDELEAHVEVEPQRVHPPEVARHDGADRHQDAPREQVERTMRPTQAVGEGPVGDSFACKQVQRTS
jgi:hypothetical protein